MFIRNRQRGFTLIELLIVVAIIGIIAAILIPNLIDALQKAKQKRTVADVRNVGSAWVSWLTDQVGAASAGATASVYDVSGLSAYTYEEVFNDLTQPDSTTFFYMQEIPQVDGWGNDLSFGKNTDNLLSGQVLIICSTGRNTDYGNNPSGATACVGGGNWNSGAFIGTDYDQDIVWADGYMIRYPGGVNQ
ncbi:MAG: prepilin-type N-terminal cleavage/methylation domain-containing protein [Acidobacteriota bacterium]